MALQIIVSFRSLKRQTIAAIMIRYLFLLLFYLVLLPNSNAQSPQSQPDETFIALASIPDVQILKKRTAVNHFASNYEIWFQQPIDYNDSSKGTFLQRVFVGHYSSEQAVIVELQGYGIYTEKAGELASHYQANQITIEHRYFNNSRPKKIDWNTLTIANAAKDQARIISAIRMALYPKSKFISTGISKGCQVSMVHRQLYPKNVDGCVCYVGPLNFKREDPRVYKFLNNVGTASQRKQIKNFQELCFQKRPALLERLQKIAKLRNYSWKFGVEKALDYTILEYSFAFWQWGTAFKDIPLSNATDDAIYDHLFAVSGYGFFEDKAVVGLQPYFWAALTEQGIYGYETAPFKKYLGTENIYNFEWAFPEGFSKPYNENLMRELQNFLDTKATNMLFIYGEYDAWSATAVELKNNAHQRDMFKYTNPKGSHSTRIRSFPIETQAEIYGKINKWLKE